MIGIFDSGFGGLSIYKKIHKLLPEYDYIYLGDSARYPYGKRSAETVYKFTKQAVDSLFQQGCELVILACNTASALALRKLQQEYLPAHYPQRRILGVIIPMVEFICEQSYSGRVGVLATSSTVQSQVFVIELKKLNPQIKVFQKAAPLLVPLVEEGWIKRRETTMIARYYLRDLKKRDIDILILGCTHFPLLIKQLRPIVGRQVSVPHPGSIVAESLKDYFSRHPEIEKRLAKNSRELFLSTDLAPRFEDLSKLFLGRMIKAQKINLE